MSHLTSPPGNAQGPSLTAWVASEWSLGSQQLSALSSCYNQNPHAWFTMCAPTPSTPFEPPISQHTQASVSPAVPQSTTSPPSPHPPSFPSPSTASVVTPSLSPSPVVPSSTAYQDQGHSQVGQDSTSTQMQDTTTPILASTSEYSNSQMGLSKPTVSDSAVSTPTSGSTTVAENDASPDSSSGMQATTHYSAYTTVSSTVSTHIFTVTGPSTTWTTHQLTTMTSREVVTVYSTGASGVTSLSPSGVSSGASSSSHSKTPQILGGVFGALAGLFLLFFAFVSFQRYRRRRRTQQKFQYDWVSRRRLSGPIFASPTASLLSYRGGGSRPSSFHTADTHMSETVPGSTYRYGALGRAVSPRLADFASPTQGETPVTPQIETRGVYPHSGQSLAQSSVESPTTHESLHNPFDGPQRISLPWQEGAGPPIGSKLSRTSASSGAPSEGVEPGYAV